MIKFITQISETLYKKKKNLDIGLNRIFLFVYTVYILHGIVYVQQFFSPSLKLNYQEFCAKREEIKIKYELRFKATIHFIQFIHSHMHLKFYLYKSKRKIIC